MFIVFLVSLFASVAYVVIVGVLAIVVAGSAPNIPPRLEFQEIQGRAVRMRDIGLPSLAAVVLGFFVSLAASFVHDRFRAPVAEWLGLNPVAYLNILFIGAALSLVALMVLLERMRTSARDLARHPSSINRAAEAMLRGARIENLDPRDLERNLARWKHGRGKSALRMVLGPSSSPRLNRHFAQYEAGFGDAAPPKGFTRALFRASIGDFPLPGSVSVGIFAVVAAGAVVGQVAGVALVLRGEIPAGYAALPIALLLGQCAVAAWYLRADARLAIRWYRMDSIELQAAGRRLSRLLEEPEVEPAPEGLIDRIAGRLGWSRRPRDGRGGTTP